MSSHGTALPEFLRIDVEDAYPGSDIIFRVEIRKASAAEGSSPIVVDLLTRPILEAGTEDIPNLEFRDYQGLSGLEHGDHLTFLLISKTVFDEKIIAEEPRGLDFNIFIRGGLHSLAN